MDAYVLPPEGGLQIIDIAGPDSLSVLQRAVDGLIQAVYSGQPELEGATAYVNEEGTFAPLPVNTRAMDLLGPPWCAGAPPVYGPLVLAGFDLLTGEHTELPPAALRRLTTIILEAS